MGREISRIEPVLPAAGISFQRHDGDDPNGVRLVQVEEREGKVIRQMPAHIAVDAPKAVGRSATVGDQVLNLVEKSPAQVGADRGVVGRRRRVFLVGLAMEAMRLHRPTILRMRADTTSPGMP